MIKRLMLAGLKLARNLTNYVSFKTACLKEKKLRHDPNWVLDKGPYGYGKIGPIMKWQVEHTKSISLAELEAMS